MKLLMHTCCAPCSVYCIDSLRKENIEPTLYWYNPNIHPYIEYKTRRNTLIEYAKMIDVNLILNEERAIVTDIEGTTRDTIEEFISIDGIPLKIIDTAGIRNAKDEVEKIGVEKAMDIAKRSDIIIAIFDSSKKLNEEDKKILELLKDKNAIILLNKIDLEKIIKVDEFKEINKPVIEISTKTKEGIDKLYEEISKMFKLKEIANDGETIVSNVRHKNIIINSRRNLEKARETINNNMPIDIISTYLKEIIEELGKITGETVTDDVITEIFSKFCLGK